MPGAPGRSPRGRPTIQGYATSMSVNAAGPPLQDQDDARTTPSTSCASATTRATARGSSWRAPPTATLPQSQPACQTPRHGSSTAGTGRYRRPGPCPPTAVSGVYLAQPRAQRHRGRAATSCSSSATTQPLDVVVPDLGRDLAGLQHLRRQQPLLLHVACPPGNPGAYKGAFKVSYNRPVDGTRRRQRARRCIIYAEYPMIRWLEPTATTSATPAAWTSRPARRCCSTTRLFISSRPRRVLVGRRSAPTSRRPAMPA